MLISRHVGLVAAPGGVAPLALRGLSVALLAAAVATGRLDWWKLLERAGRVPACGRRGWLGVAALGLTLSGAGGAEEVAADDQDGRLLDAVKHAAVKLVLEATAFYALLGIAVSCGLAAGGSDDRSELLAYLADTLAGGWGEPIVYAAASSAFVAARAVAHAALLAPTGSAAGGDRDVGRVASRSLRPGNFTCERSPGCRSFW